MTTVQRRVTLMLVALLMLLAVVAAYGPRLAPELPTFGPSSAEASKECRDRHHYHAFLDVQHYVYKTTQAGPNQVKTYWKEQRLYGDHGIRKIGTKLC